MSDRTIASRPSLEQVVAIVNFMEKHPTLAMGQLRGQEGRELSNSLWHQLTQTVNAIPGPSRPMKSWVKYWADKKSTIRQKVQANGDDPDSLSSNIDRKVWDLFVSPIPYKGPRSFKKEAYIQETYFRDEEEEEKEEEEDSMDQNKEAEPVILEFEEPVVDFEERQAAVMEKLVKVMSSQASALTQLAHASQSGAQAMDRLAEASLIQARAIDRLATSFESISSSSHDVRSAIMDIDTTMKRFYTTSPT